MAVDFVIRWQDDWDIGSHVREFGTEIYPEEPNTCECCTVSLPDGTVLASLGCIDEATPEYRREIEAELVAEAMTEFANQLAKAAWPDVVRAAKSNPMPAEATPMLYAYGPTQYVIDWPDYHSYARTPLIEVEVVEYETVEQLAYAIVQELEA